MNAVTCLTWVRRGVAKAHPELVRLPDDELENLLSSAGRGAAETDSSSDQFDSDDEKQRKTAKRGNLDEAKDSVEMRYHLDDYDDEDGGTENEEAGLGKLSFYTSNRHDPYLSKDDQSSDNESDLSVSPGDNLIALGKVHGEFFSLEVWVTNVDDGSVYCHHDVILSSCPLAMEWVGFDPGESDSSSANLVAVGSMTPSIELWDLDVVNTLEPVFTLKSKQRCRRKEKAAKKVAESQGHTDAVLALSWNTNRQQILASASADLSVGLWDLSRGRAVSFLAGHGDKVQAVQWHPAEDQLLVSGCYDGCVRLFDCRAPSADASRQWTFSGEVEKVIWDHHDPFYLFAGTDGGALCCVDVRLSAPIFIDESAHTSSLSSLALSPSATGCLLSASADHSVKLWDVRDHSSPNLVRRQACKIGKIHCAAACPDEPLLFCVGGEFEMKLINFCNDETVTQKFAVSNLDSSVTTVTNVGPADSTVSSPSADNLSTSKKLRKSKIPSPDLSSGSSDVVKKSRKYDRIDRRMSEKCAKSKLKPVSSVEKLKTSVMSSRLSNAGLTSKTVSNIGISDDTANSPSPDNQSWIKTFKKNEISAAHLGSGSLGTINESHKSDRAACKMSKKSKQSKVEADMTITKAKVSGKPGHEKNKHMKHMKSN